MSGETATVIRFPVERRQPHRSGHAVRATGVLRLRGAMVALQAQGRHASR